MGQLCGSCIVLINLRCIDEIPAGQLCIRGPVIAAIAHGCVAPLLVSHARALLALGLQLYTGHTHTRERETSLSHTFLTHTSVHARALLALGLQLYTGHTHTLERERPLSHTHSSHTHPCMHGLFSRLASTVYRFLECVCVGGSSVCESVCVGFARVRVRVCVLVSPVWVYVWVWERVRVFLGGDLRNLARSQALNPRPLRNQARSQALNPRPLRNLARSQALNPKP